MGGRVVVGRCEGFDDSTHDFAFSVAFGMSRYEGLQDVIPI